ncbi:MAG: hypothetical protein IPO70_06730 [Bacteroidetes bacterium]|nr:hypothetical protein [Bacteroidota bacterium]
MMNAKTKLLLKWLNKERKLIYRIYALAFLQGALYIAIPLVIQGMITYVMAGKFSASLFLLCLLVISITLLIGFFQLWQMRLNETLHEKIFCNLTDRLAQLTIKNKEAKKKIVHFFEVVTLQKGIGKVLLEFSFSVISIIFGILLLPAYSNWFFIFSVLLGITFF